MEFSYLETAKKPDQITLNAPSVAFGDTTPSALYFVDDLVAGTYRIPRTALHAGTRCRQPVAFARQVAMYLGHVCLSYPLNELATHYGRDRTTVSHACRVVEDKREDENLELLLNCLESSLEILMMLTPLSWNNSK